MTDLWPFFCVFGGSFFNRSLPEVAWGGDKSLTCPESRFGASKRSESATGRDQTSAPSTYAILGGNAARPATNTEPTEPDTTRVSPSREQSRSVLVAGRAAFPPRIA